MRRAQLALLRLRGDLRRQPRDLHLVAHLAEPRLEPSSLGEPPRVRLLLLDEVVLGGRRLRPPPQAHRLKTLEEIVETLSMIGLEVEGVEDKAKELAPFTVAYVKEAKPHPNADRLRVCLVDTGSEEVQVVCGAPNARTGMYGVFAPVGVHVPGTGIDLKAGKIRGEASNGMLVSEREMGLSDDHEGIIDLEAAGVSEMPALGTPFARVMGLDDPVIDVGITPNRGDCLSVRGIARDLAAAARLCDAAALRRQTFHQRPLPGDVAHDAAHACGRALIGLDIGGVVVALHLEDAGLTVADIDHPGVLARALDHPRSRRGEFAQVLSAGLVGAVLAPHDREDT